VRGARDNVAFRNLGRWDRSNRVNCGRCRARRALVAGSGTRTHLVTRSEWRLRATGHKKTIGARATSSFELYGSSWGSQPRSGLNFEKDVEGVNEREIFLWICLLRFSISVWALVQKLKTTVKKIQINISQSLNPPTFFSKMSKDVNTLRHFVIVPIHDRRNNRASR